MDNAKVQIYTGDGKGKTTAALGLCFRAMGRGLKAVVVQFRKSRLSGEHIEAERTGLPIQICGEGRKAIPCSVPCRMLERAREILLYEKPDLLVLDEVTGAISNSCITIAEILSLISEGKGGTEFILTGRDAPEELIRAADLVTSMEPVKHYFKDGVKAREGIEY